MKTWNITCLPISRLNTSRSVTYYCDHDFFVNGVELFRWGRERWHLISKKPHGCHGFQEAQAEPVYIRNKMSSLLSVWISAIENSNSSQNIPVHTGWAEWPNDDAVWWRQQSDPSPSGSLDYRIALARTPQCLISGNKARYVTQSSHVTL